MEQLPDVLAVHRDVGRVVHGGEGPTRGGLHVGRVGVEAHPSDPGLLPPTVLEQDVGMVRRHLDVIPFRADDDHAQPGKEAQGLVVIAAHIADGPVFPGFLQGGHVLGPRVYKAHLHRRLQDRGGVDPLFPAREGAKVRAQDVVPLVVAPVPVEVVIENSPCAPALGPPAAGDSLGIPAQVRVVHITFGSSRGQPAGAGGVEGELLVPGAQIHRGELHPGRVLPAHIPVDGHFVPEEPQGDDGGVTPVGGADQAHLEDGIGEEV